jgi:phosphoribosylglycinamide formyltransferase-1
MSTPEAKVGILISGRGSNMISLVRAMRSGAVSAEPVVVISNRPDAAGLRAAADLGVATVVVDQAEVRPRAAHERRVVEVLRDHGAGWVCLAGYMRLLKGALLEAYPERILNIHPSLLPAFPGLHAQDQALEYGVRVAGCTVHLVDEQCDHGPIVAQAAVPVLDDDTEDSLSARILEQEHALYPEALRRVLGGGWSVDGRRLAFRPASRSAN